jgi:N-acetylglutamate synthase-like GNAT family acetyltransferase
MKNWCPIMQTSIVLLCFLLVSGVSKAFRARSADALDVDELIRQYAAMDEDYLMEEGNESYYQIDENEDWRTVENDLKESLSGYDDPRLIQVNGIDLTSTSIPLIGNGVQLRHEAVELLVQQNAVSGLPDSAELLHEKLPKTTKTILVVIRDATGQFHVKAVAAMKNTEMDRVGGYKWCEAGYIVVDPSIQGRGVGSTLWRALRVVAKEIKVEAFFTETLLSNAASLKLQRHNCVEKLIVGLFVETSACSKFPERPDLKLLVMLFPVVESKENGARLLKIADSIRNTYKEMRKKGQIVSWVDNEPIGPNASRFLNYVEIKKAVDEDPTIQENYANHFGFKNSGVDWEEWKTSYAQAIAKELLGGRHPLVTQRKSKTSPQTPGERGKGGESILQILSRGLMQPTPTRDSGAKIWNNKVVMVGLGVLILMNCVLLASAAYFRIYPRQAPRDGEITVTKDRNMDTAAATVMQ